MDEKDILLKTIEAQNATMESLSATIKEQAERIKELTAQVAYLNRQLFGRKSEKLSHLPGQMELFTDEFADQLRQAEEKRDEVVAEIDKDTKAERKQKRQNRIMMEDLPVLEREVLEPEGIDLSIYKKMGEEVTRIVKHQPGMLYVKEIVRPKYGLRDNTMLPAKGQSSVLIAPMPLLPIYKGIADATLLTEILLQKYEYHVQIPEHTHPVIAINSGAYPFIRFDEFG